MRSFSRMLPSFGAIYMSVTSASTKGGVNYHLAMGHNNMGTMSYEARKEDVMDLVEIVLGSKKDLPIPFEVVYNNFMGAWLSGKSSNVFI